MPVTAEDVQNRIAAVEAATGQTLPDVEPTGGGPTPVAVAPVVTPEPTPPTPAADPFDVPTNTTFDRPYVERLRAEAAEYRTKAQAYKDLESLTPEKRDAWLTLARTMETNPTQAYQWLDEIVKSAPEVLQQQGGPAPVSVVPAGEAPLTRADLDQILGQRDAAQVEKQLINEVYGDLKAVGIDAESSDPVEAATAIAIMKVAAETTGGDIKAAYDLVVTGPRQKAIDAFVAEKATQGRTPRPVTGQAPSGERTRPEGMSPLEWSR